MLTQKMINSPITCQYYVTKALEPMRKQFLNFLVIHYMEDILFSTPCVLETRHKFDITQQCLIASRLIIDLEKIKTSAPSVRFSHSVVSDPL